MSHSYQDSDLGLLHYIDKYTLRLHRYTGFHALIGYGFHQREPYFRPS